MRFLAAPALAMALMGQGTARADPALAPLAGPGSEPNAPWRVALLPRQTKPVTHFEVVALDGRRVLRVEAQSSYGNLVHPLPGEASAAAAAHHLSWRWRVDDLNMAADLRERAGDDTTIKVCAMFDMPLERIPFGERQVLRAARAFSKDPLPGATVCYVWDSQLPPGTELPSAYTGRLRYMVLESGPAHAHEWLPEQRDVAADFLRLFGDESRDVPPLVGIAIGADTDNTRAHSLAHVSDMSLE